MTAILVTRPQPDATATAQRLEAIGITPVIAPVLTMRPLPCVLPRPDAVAALAVTSANALRALAHHAALGPYFDLPLFAIGDRTAQLAMDLGFTSVVSANGGLTELVDAIAATRFAKPIFYPAPRHQAGDLGKLLAPTGQEVVVARVYDMVAAHALPDAGLQALTRGDLDAVLLYSRRTAEIFATLAEPVLTPPERERLFMLCLSEAVAAPLLERRFPRIGLAEHPSEDAMIALALSFSREKNGP